MQRIMFTLLFSTLALTGFGCGKPPAERPTPPSSSPITIEQRQEEAPRTQKQLLSKSDPCPSGTIRYWHVDEWGEGLTFCHEETSVNGLPVMIRTEGNTTILSIEGFEQTITPISTLNSPETGEDLVGRFLTQENKEVCSVVLNKSTYDMMDRYVVSGGDLESQESCGSAKDGTFYVRRESPREMFYVRTGQDVLLASETWTETLRFVFTYGETEDPTPSTNLSWLNAGPLARYEDREMGIAFDYPVRWGPILRGEELGSTKMATTDYTNPEIDCVHQRQLIFTGLGRSTVVGVVGDAEGICEIGGRGGYFGDNANHLIPDLAIHAECEEGIADVCETIQTTKGMSLWHWHYNELDYFGERRTDVDEYAAYHTGHPLSGIVFSDERIISANLDALDPLFTAMVKTLELIPAT